MLRFKRKVINFLLRTLFNSLTERDLVTVRYLNPAKSVAQLNLNGKPLPKGMAEQISSEARIFQKMELYHVLFNTPKVEANKMMYQNSTKDSDLYFGKAVLWAVSLIEGQVALLSSVTAFTDSQKDPQEIVSSPLEQSQE